VKHARRLRDGAGRLVRHAYRDADVLAARARPRLGLLTTATLDHLFAYGTLMTGFVRRPLLGPDAILVGPARVRGSLFDFGEYPGLVLDDSGWVVGELYRVPDLATRLPTLDRAEWYDSADEAGSLYVRRPAAVTLTDGSARDVWLYVYNGPPGRGPRIPSGDWRARVQARGAVSG
jgi:gamma-glutamylcyclotransferase (GGCT)/AIG2-like uncharacterized protein YtfP